MCLHNGSPIFSEYCRPLWAGSEAVSSRWARHPIEGSIKGTNILLKLFERKRGPRDLSFARMIFENPKRSKDVQFFDMLPYVALIDDQTVVTKDGELIGTVLLHGFSAETSSDFDIEQRVSEFAQLISQTEDTAAIYVNKIVTFRGIPNSFIGGEGFDAHVDQAWSKTFDLLPAMQRYVLVSFGVRPNYSQEIIGQDTGEAKTKDKRQTL